MAFADITITPVRSGRKAACLAFSARVAAVCHEYGTQRVVDCRQVADESDATPFWHSGLGPNRTVRVVAKRTG